MAADDPSDQLRDALAALLKVGDLPASVREEISASWLRSAQSGLTPTQFEVPYVADIDDDGRLVHAAHPVLAKLAEDLSATSMGVILTNERGHVLDRRVSDRSLHSRLDSILLAPGFVYAEDEVGTNAIGTALEQRGPSVVQGFEHFADSLTTMACAAVPITDPRTGRILGAIDLTCWAEDAHALMLPFVRQAAREIEQRLVGDVSGAERTLLQRFFVERRRAKGPIVLVSKGTMLTNAAADRLVDPADAPILRDIASRLLVSGSANPSSELVLGGGEKVVIAFEPILDASGVSGAVLRLRPASSGDHAAPTRQPRGAFGWNSLTDGERRVTDLVAQGLTNRQVADRLFMSRHTVDSHLRAIFRKLNLKSRVELTRAVLERSRSSLT
jgi:DNA-binding CsgD family transcriptional regulator